MSLSEIIPPEVKGDSFYFDIFNIIKNDNNIKNILEIGSSSGEGTTEAIINAIKDRPDIDKINLFCMELSRPRFFKLCDNYKNYSFMKPYNLSSISLDEFPSEDEIIFFYSNTKTNLNHASLVTVLTWLNQDISYVKQNSLDFNGINFIKQANKLTDFDFVLLDGSEFTGERELHQTIGARYIALDDVNSFKCFNCYKILSACTSYNLFSQDLNLRNGYAIFKRSY